MLDPQKRKSIVADFLKSLHPTMKSNGDKSWIVGTKEDPRIFILSEQLRPIDELLHAVGKIATGDQPKTVHVVFHLPTEQAYLKLSPYITFVTVTDLCEQGFGVNSQPSAAVTPEA
ncbi:MAG: hypothetical protein EOP06_11555 [Proteobacteria bacterium]|nr:MAG: hypothetical protein EOP06_11555 [Pseudomonadota bacterium]